MNDLRTMVHFPIGDRLFNYRAAAIIIRDGHVLTCQEDDDEYIMLPGGRVELGEASDAALARELAEEVQAPAAIGRLVYTVENFFGHNGKVVHELGAKFFWAKSECHRLGEKIMCFEEAASYTATHEPD